MVIYVFGNQDHEQDSLAFKVMEKLQGTKGVTFEVVKPNEDLPFANGMDVILMDVVDGIEKVTLIDEDTPCELVLPPRYSVHDFDLGFQIKYLKKLGKLGKVTIIGLPIETKMKLEKIVKEISKLIKTSIIL